MQETVWRTSGCRIDSASLNSEIEIAVALLHFEVFLISSIFCEKLLTVVQIRNVLGKTTCSFTGFDLLTKNYFDAMTHRFYHHVIK